MCFHVYKIPKVTSLNFSISDEQKIYIILKLHYTNKSLMQHLVLSQCYIYCTISTVYTSRGPSIPNKNSDGLCYNDPDLQYKPNTNEPVQNH